MTRHLPQTLLVLAALAVAVVGYTIWGNYETTFRYRLTATVESGGQFYTGNGVIQVQIILQRLSFSGHASLPKVTGDAVVVDVPGRSPIFFLLSADGNVDWDANIAFTMFRQLLPDPARAKETAENISAMVRLEARAEIPRDSYPRMVAFEDVQRPASVYEVFPDDLSRPLDPGARVVSLTIDMTRDQVSTGIVEAKLPWLVTLEAHLDGDPYQTTGSGFANTISRVDFVKRGL